MIQLKEMSFSYGNHSFIEKLNLDIKKGEVVGIVGPNGSGKSTILKNITGKLQHQSGGIYLDQEEILEMHAKKISRKMASLSQHQTSSGDFSVKELIRFGRLPHKKWYESYNDEDAACVEWAMDKTGVKCFEDKCAHTLSGGEKQRVWIAMTLAQKPEVLLLDEPTTFLDMCHQMEVLDLVKSLNKELGVTVIMVLHDLNQACQYCDRICVMKQGAVYEIGEPEVVMTENLIRNVYNVHAAVNIDEEGVHIRPKRVFKGDQNVK